MVAGAAVGIAIGAAIGLGIPCLGFLGLSLLA